MKNELIIIFFIILVLLIINTFSLIYIININKNSIQINKINPSKDIKSEELVLYKSINQKIKEYSIYYYGVFLFFIIIYIILKKEDNTKIEGKNE